MKLKQSVITDVGRKRDHNEDFVLSHDELGIYVVCDGMGGHNAGEVASKIAAESTINYLVQNRETIDAFRSTPKKNLLHDIKELVKASVNNACREVFNYAAAHPECQGMGTTLVMSLVVNQVAIIAHVGDSRAYLLRGKKEIQITEDHSFVNEMVREGLLTPEEAEHHPNSNVITRALGLREFTSPEVISIELMADDLLFLCSDGLSGYLNKGELLSVVKNIDFENFGNALIELANHRGGKDNISVISLGYDRSSSPPAHPDKVSAADKERVLHQIPLFRKLNFKELAKLLEITELKTYDEGEELIREQESGETMYIIVRGKVSVENQGNAITDLKMGSFFGEMSLIDNRGRNATIRAIEKTTTLIIGRVPLLELFKKDNKLGVKILWALIQNMNKRLRINDEKLFELKKYFGNMDPEATEEFKIKF